ncbi:hypothetical protein [Phormidium sp. FACHB-1136]|uniref:hypothetical protein n=1 Tax=Phormidium sp. FACHB-1136 TaxID=2692848 RepID=UPI0016827CC3|nr:hypothetical protein [Phormidium sp. FACHB-1136]MBD2425907.1 hypothetical protein [Phormidium sp. FACHB-1136]
MQAIVAGFPALGFRPHRIRTAFELQQCGLKPDLAGAGATSAPILLPPFRQYEVNFHGDQ